MYKSIVFDLGGVMVDFAPRAYLVDRICNEEIEEQVYDLTFGSEEWKQLDAGLVSRFDGNQAMLRNAKAAVEEGIVAGGGVAFMDAIPALDGIAYDDTPGASLRCRACWTTGCTSCARAAGCRSWCAA